MTARITGTKFRVGDKVWFLRWMTDVHVDTPCGTCGKWGLCDCPECGGSGCVVTRQWEAHSSTVWTVTVCQSRRLSGSENIKTGIDEWYELQEQHYVPDLSDPTRTMWEPELLYATKRAAKAAATRANKEPEGGESHTWSVKI